MKMLKVADCCDDIRAAYAQIGSGDLGYIPHALASVVRVLNQVALDERVPADLRQQAAQSCANLLMSDYAHDELNER